jgi:O-methyltransferase
MHVRGGGIPLPRSPELRSEELPPLSRQYLDLLEGALTRSLYDATLEPLRPKAGTWRARVLAPVERLLRRAGMTLARRHSSEDVFAESPPQILYSTDTLIGPVGLRHLRDVIGQIVRTDVPGDLIETGVWRGGAVIYMRAVLQAYGDDRRTVWAADSFAGLPAPGATEYDQDTQDKDWSRETWLAVSLDEVKRNFERYGLLDDRVKFLVGWFKDTLHDERIGPLALIRLDGDMYGSTTDALRALYPKLSVGGFVVIDDYWLPNCKAAVDDFRRENRIDDELVQVDRAIVYWRRSARPVSRGATRFERRRPPVASHLGTRRVKSRPRR